MKINYTNNLETYLLEELEPMKMALCFDKDSNENVIYIRLIAENKALIISNFDNAKDSVCILYNSNMKKEIFFIGYINDFDLNIRGLKK